MQLTVNGKIIDIASDPDTPLLWVIRNELNLTGTKFGCGGGHCGSCTVQIDGESVRSCITAVKDAADKRIRTIEDLADEDGNLHPIQQAFIDNQVPQCAWCMSGQMMTALSFLETTQAPSDDQIVTAMGENYCRCGCYVRIKAAVRDAATIMGEANE